MDSSIGDFVSLYGSSLSLYHSHSLPLSLYLSVERYYYVQTQTLLLSRARVVLKGSSASLLISYKLLQALALYPYPKAAESGESTSLLKYQKSLYTFYPMHRAASIYARTQKQGKSFSVFSI